MNEQDEIEQILKDYRGVLTQQMGLILSGKHRLDIKTADKMLIDEPKQAITTLLELQYKKGIEYGKLIQLNKTNGVIYNGITYRKGDLAALEGDK